MADLTTAQLEQMLHDLDAHPQEQFWSCRRETARKLIEAARDTVRWREEIAQLATTKASRSPA